MKEKIATTKKKRKNTPTTTKKYTMEAFRTYYDIRKSFPFYGAYHRDKTNILLHIIGVPTIATTALYFFSHLKLAFIDSLLSSSSATALLVPAGGASVADLLIALYGVSFLFMEPVAAALYLPVLFGMRHVGCVMLQGKRDLAIGLHVAAWIMQFIGHGVFEGRKPALFDSFFQSVHAAVFFVWLELLFALGYRPKLAKELDDAAAALVPKDAKTA